MIFLCQLNSFALDPVKNQEIIGNHNINVLGDNNKITVQANEKVDKKLAEINDKFSKTLDVLINFQNKKVEELNKELADIFIQDIGGTDEDAKKWAKNIIDNAPEVKKQLENNERIRIQYNLELSKGLLTKVYNLYVYIYEKIDQRFMALKELNNKIKYEKDDKFILFNDESTRIDPYNSRTLILANGNNIIIQCLPGKIEQGFIRECPSLSFYEVVGEKILQSFSIHPSWGGVLTGGGGEVPYQEKKKLESISYPKNGKEILTDDFEIKFNSTFEEFIQTAFAR
jgi:hypothetical protein